MKIVWKLTLMNTALLSAVVVSLFYVFYKSYETALFRAEIYHMRRIVQTEFERHPRGGMRGMAGMSPLRGIGRLFVAKVVNGDVEIINDPFGISPSFKPKEGIVEIDGEYYLFITVRRPNGDYYVATDVSPAMSALESAKRTGIILSVVGIGVSFLISYLLSSISLSPIRQMIKELGSIKPASLDRRIENPGTGDEVSKLVEEINSMLDRIERAYRSQERFVHDVSHELRNPISSMKGFLRVLRKYGKRDEGIFDESLDELESTVDEMESIVENLLLLSKPETKIEKVKVRISEVVEEVLKKMKSERLIFEKRSDPVIETSPELFSIIIKNLLENALKYSDSEVRVVLENDHLEVIDKGPGIPEGERDMIFERFYRLDKSRDRRKRGHGLGLAIVKELCEKLGLRIHLESEVGKGSKFTISWN